VKAVTKRADDGDFFRDPVNKEVDLFVDRLVFQEHCTITIVGEAFAVLPLVFQDSRNRLLRAGKLRKLLVLAHERLRRRHAPRSTVRLLVLLDEILSDGPRASRGPDIPGVPKALGERFLETLEEGARKSPFGIRDLLCLDLCTGEAKTAVSGLNITLTREDAVPTLSIPVAQMTFAPELSMSPADDQRNLNCGCLTFRFCALRQNWLDRAPV
jgi:hypothetical protein